MHLREMISFLPMLVRDMQENPQDYPEVCEECDGEGCLVCYGRGIIVHQEAK